MRCAGQRKNIKKYEEQIAKIKATELKSMTRFSRALYNNYVTVDQAFEAMMR